MYIAIVELYLLIPPVRFLLKRKFGIEVYPFMILWKKRAEAKPIKKNRAIKVLFSIGLGLVFIWIAIFYIFIVPAMVGFIEGIFQGREAQPPIVPIIAGVTIKGIYILYFALAASIAVLFHELLHVLAARSEGVKLRSWGIGLLFIFPLAFVEFDEESFRSSGIMAKLRILSAGILANTIVAVVAFLVLQIITSNALTAVVVVEVDKNWPADLAGMKNGDIIMSINNSKIRSIRDLAQILKPYSNSTALFLVKVFRPGIGPKILKVLKPSEYPRLGIRVTETFVTQSPSGMYVVDTPKIHSFRILQWIYIINASLAAINAAPLFITDGGKIVSELTNRFGSLGKMISSTIQSFTVILVIVTISLALITTIHG